MNPSATERVSLFTLPNIFSSRLCSFVNCLSNSLDLSTFITSFQYRGRGYAGLYVKWLTNLRKRPNPPVLICVLGCFWFLPGDLVPPLIVPFLLFLFPMSILFYIVTIYT